MAGKKKPSSRETFLLDDQYLLAIEQGGLPAQWPVCTGH
jgi:hypothetical protein